MNVLTPATIKSVAYLAKLRGVVPTNEQFWLMCDRGQDFVDAQILAYGGQVASVTVTLPRADTSVERGEWHCVDEKFYLVAKSQASGRLYVKVRLAGGGFDLASGMIKRLSAATRVNASHAELIREFGNMHDACMFCMKPLDVPESRMAGCGEKCASKNGIPWGTH